MKINIKCQTCGKSITIIVNYVDASTSTERILLRDRPNIIQNCNHNNMEAINKILDGFPQRKPR